MQKNWYVLYTKAKCEKKVAALLTKRKIQNFCPTNCKHVREYRRNKVLYEPLFASYVFVRIDKSSISLLKEFDNVINVAYWKREPAIIEADEIEAIKQFSAHHKSIILEKIPINIDSQPGSIDNASYSMDGNILIIKNKSVKVNLPSLGFRMIAEVEGKGVLGREIGVRDKEIQMS